jgi:hypothetical protein
MTALRISTVPTASACPRVYQEWMKSSICKFQLEGTSVPSPIKTLSAVYNEKDFDSKRGFPWLPTVYLI